MKQALFFPVLKYFANFSRFDFHCGVSWVKQQQGTVQVDEKSTVLLNEMYQRQHMHIIFYKILPNRIM